jgi:hypothetical protein
MPWYKKIDIAVDIFRQANFGKSFNKKNIIIRLKVILDAFLVK